MVRALGGLVAAVALVVLAMAALGSFGPSKPVRTAATATPMLQPTPTRTAAASAPRTITITFTEEDLTTAARSLMPLTVGGITVSDPRVRLEAGRLTLTATGRAFIVSGPVVVVASPVVAGGTAGANIESATFVGLGVPEATKRDIGDTFSRVLAANIPSGVRVTAVTIAGGTLVVEALPA